MRTTLTLDDDVAAALKRLRQARKASFKDVVNDALRQGLRELSVRPKRHETFRTEIVSLGRLRLPSIDNISEILATAEDETFR